MRLRELGADRYAAEVLPLTAEIWAGRRDLQTYVAENLEVARSRYGRKHYRTFGFFDGKTLVASFKKYDRTMRLEARRLHAIGIGAVFTPKGQRGHGYATAMLATALDGAREEGYDIAFLFSDIGSAFYASVGFRELPSRELSLRADALPNRRLAVARLGERDWSGVARCYDLCERHAETGFVRTPLVWNWIRTLRRMRAARSIGEQTDLVVRHGRGVGAYVLGSRVPQRDTYELEEFGFADDDAAAVVPALLRAAAGDLRRITGWLPPSGARELLPKGSVRKRRGPLLMVAPLSPQGVTLARALAESSRGDRCWETDHV
jgi:predicted N-acetyltransferase YhbS